MLVVKMIFLSSLFILIYTYVGYPSILLLLSFVKKLFISKKRIQQNVYPPVTIVVAAFNEGVIIESKIKNLLTLSYPKDKLHFIFVNDGSTDNTLEIIKKFQFIEVINIEKRTGKANALNEALKIVKTPYVIFNDANNLINQNAVEKLIQCFDSKNTGGVTGEKNITYTNLNSVASVEKSYWKYENLIKKTESEIYSTIGSTGEIFAIKTELFSKIPKEMILDDFFISMKIVLNGNSIIYCPEAVAKEAPSNNLQDEMKRKIRIAAGCFQILKKMPSLMNIFLHPMISWQFISHKLFRWLFSPLSLMMFFLCNILLLYNDPSWLYKLSFLIQFIFYCLAFAGYFLSINKFRSSFFYFPFYFVFTNFCMVAGLIKFIFNKQTVLWDKAQR